MGNKVKGIDVKTKHTTFSMIWSTLKKLKKIDKSHTNMFLFTILDMRQSKIQNT